MHYLQRAMFSTCIFCNSPLGANEAVEHFPVGRRLAFDSAHGRLWVVCRTCERWNLSPLEERWEAIEECERLFRSTRLRMSTENIGLARAGDGLTLVRIGSPQRPEMAAWRYGDQFGRRRRKHLLYTGLGLAATTGAAVLGPVTHLIAGGALITTIASGVTAISSVVNTTANVFRQRRVRTLTVPEFTVPVSVRLDQLYRVTLVPASDGWALNVPIQGPRSEPVHLKNGRMLQASRWNGPQWISTTLTGDVALRAAAKLLPVLNASGAKREQLSSAVNLLGETPDPSALFKYFADHSPSRIQRFGKSTPEGAVVNLPQDVRLALEMATHEDSERRALEGELATLEAAWRDADEVAAIADNLVLPDDVLHRFHALKRAD